MPIPVVREESSTKGRKCHVCGSAKKLLRYVGQKFFCADHTAEAYKEAVSVRRGSYLKMNPNVSLLDGPDVLTRVRRADGMIPDCCPMFENVPPEDGWQEPSV